MGRKKDKKNILIITPFFPPNLGGVETYSNVLTTGLSKNGYKVYVSTYSPIGQKFLKLIFGIQESFEVGIRIYVIT